MKKTLQIKESRRMAVTVIIASLLVMLVIKKLPEEFHFQHMYPVIYFVIIGLSLLIVRLTTSTLNKGTWILLLFAWLVPPIMFLVR